MNRGPLQPCGTPAAYQRHIRRRETPCGPCRAAIRATWRSQYTARELQPCGTVAAARRHYRRGEPLDQACLQANRLSLAERAGHDVRSFAPDLREIRNGLPPFRPYVYRGLGYDQYQHLYEEAS